MEVIAVKMEEDLAAAPTLASSMLPLVPPCTPTNAAAPAPATIKPSKGTSSMTQLGETGRENTGRWTCEEHVLFLKGLEMHGKGWKKIAKLIKTRTVVQIRTHAQKYFQKLAKAKKNGHHGDLLGMEGTRFGGKRVKFTGKRRGMIYGSYLVGVEATSAAISPALQTYMPAAPAADQQPLSDKEEDAAIERGLYRFLSPVVMDPSAHALDAAAPEVLPPSSGTTGTGGAGGEVGKEGDTMDLGGENGDDAESTAEPLPTLARVTPDMYTACGVPEWFKKGGDIDELLAEAASVDWRTDTGGDARKALEQGTSVLIANINNCTQPPRRKTSTTNAAGAGTGAAGTGPLVPGNRNSVGSSIITSSAAMAASSASSSGGGRGGGRDNHGAASKLLLQQVKQEVIAPPLEEEEDDFAAFDLHNVELKEEHSHHDLLLDDFAASHVGADDALSHLVYSTAHGKGVASTRHHHHHHHHEEEVDHLHSYDVYLEEAGGEAGHDLLLLDDLDGGIEF